ncbi:Gp138 family membrane-puncturing spike protein [Aurantimonas coralicida]|uniref:Gp138 family membrane-puncturing spike protein n=1 Tax=Aurantimonas coralicida TaxID=182270 RepID=UPI001E47CAE4|nr:Gp138 family membrane-puncturing spike protein [Aurantimonas coralicida]MCD1645240.1 hypothetical protein [Aurantimonas coralicida]
MVGHVGKYTNWAEDVSHSDTREEREDMWGEMQGEIVEIDYEKQAAKVKVLYKKRLNGTPTNLPELLEVPVRFPRTPQFALTWPIPAGTRGTLRPKMRNTEAFHEGNADYEAADMRSFSLSDMEFYPDGGGNGVADPLPKFNTQNAELRTADGQFAMEMSPDGKFRMRGSMGDWYDIVAQVVELLGKDKLTIKTGSSAGSLHELQFKEQYVALGEKLRGMALAGS